MEWTAVRSHLRDRYLIAIDEPELVGVVWTIDGAQQRELVYPVIVDGVGYVVMMAIVATADAMSPLELLARGSRLSIGSVCLIDHSYFVRVLLPLENVTEAVIDRTVVAIAWTAHQMRCELTTPAAAAPYYE